MFGSGEGCGAAGAEFAGGKSTNEKSAGAHRWGTLAVACSIALVVLVVCSCSVTLGDSDDDLAIGALLSGRYPEGSVSLFVNAALCALVYGLNCVVPSINWFFAVERIVFFVALAGVVYAAIRYHKTRPALLVFAAAFCVFLAPLCTYNGNFTAVAGAAVCAGCALLLCAMREARQRARRPWGLAVVGCLLLVAGFSLRANMLLLGLPFLLASSIWALVGGRCGRTHAGEQGEDRARASCSVRFLAPIVVPVCACVVVCAGLFAFDAAVWQQDDLSSWKETNDARAVLSDYPLRPYAEIAGELQQIGVSENDYALMGSWATCDTDYFSAELLQRVADLQSVSNAGALENVLAGFSAYLAQMATSKKLIACLLVVIIVTCACSWKNMPWVGAAVLGTLVLCSYFLGAGRLMSRVEMPLWCLCFGAIAACAFPPRPDRQSVYSGVCAGVGGLLVVTFLVAVLPSCSLQTGLSAFQQDGYQPDDATGVIAYTEQEEDMIFVWDTLTYASVEEAYGFRNLPSASYLARNLTLGGWDVGSPQLAARDEVLGIENGLRALAVDERARLVSFDPKTISMVVVYAEEHYGITLESQVCQEFSDGTKVYRLTAA